MAAVCIVDYANVDQAVDDPYFGKITFVSCIDTSFRDGVTGGDCQASASRGWTRFSHIWHAISGIWRSL
jgi:hypothetical protein